MPRTPRARSVLNRNEDLTHLEDLWDEPPPSAAPPPADAGVLRGAWQSVAGRREGKLLISGDRLTVHFADGTIYMGVVTLGRHGRFGTMDVLVEEGPPHHKGLVALCIYELDGDTLRWCTASPGQSARPSAFEEHDPQHLHLVFRREQSNCKQ